jgi:hypothetical protein
MKKIFLLFTLLSIAGISVAQSFSSNKFSNNDSFYERIDLHDTEGNVVVTVSPRFYKQKNIKKKIKPIKVNDKTYFIKKEKHGVQAVYTKDGEYVALMKRNENSIQLVGDTQKYSLRLKVRLANFNILECKNSEGTVVSTTTFNNERKLIYEEGGEQDSNSLLMALCIHQFQELLLGNRGRLSSFSEAYLILSSQGVY